MFKLKINPKKSPSQRFADYGRLAAHSFVSGMQKAQIIILKSNLKPYELPSASWANDYMSIIKNEFEYMKRWYD